MEGLLYFILIAEFFLSNPVHNRFVFPRYLANVCVTAKGYPRDLIDLPRWSPCRSARRFIDVISDTSCTPPVSRPPLRQANLCGQKGAEARVGLPQTALRQTKQPNGRRLALHR